MASRHWEANLLYLRGEPVKVAGPSRFSFYYRCPGRDLRKSSGMSGGGGGGGVVLTRCLGVPRPARLQKAKDKMKTLCNTVWLPQANVMAMLEKLGPYGQDPTGRVHEGCPLKWVDELDMISHAEPTTQKTEHLSHSPFFSIAPNVSFCFFRR